MTEIDHTGYIDTEFEESASPLPPSLSIITALMATGQSPETAARVAKAILKQLGREGITLVRNEPTEAAEPQDEAIPGPDPRAVDIVATVAAAAVARLRGDDDWMEDDEAYVIWSTPQDDEPDATPGIVVGIRDSDDNLEAHLQFDNPQDAILFACQVSGAAYQVMLGVHE